MPDPVVLDFSASLADQERVGGKGANLALLARAGFPVPPGFCVTTHAYREVVSGDLADAIGRLVDAFDYDNADDLERKTAEIRSLIVAAQIPQRTRDAIARAYADLGEEPYVAVRSSGTAEDLADTSFAGLHDTYLDIRGVDEVVDAVKRCWASLWTARATAYRAKNAFDHRQVALSVVVQTMVAAEASGVMFTANPMSGSTAEIVINASYGLGEAIVSGIVTPDEIAVAAGTTEIVERTVGEKALRIDRSPDGDGTVTTEVPSSDRTRLSVTDEQIMALASLARRVEADYGDVPQDIEWALADGSVFVLQSRPVTGVELSWDAEVDAWQATAEDHDVTWTRAMADEVWTGATTPLFYSWRAYLWQTSHDDLCRLCDLPEAEGQWFWKFHRAKAYYNTKLQRQLVERATPPPFRGLMLGTLPPEERADAQGAPFDYFAHLRRYLKTQIAHPRRGLLAWQRKFDELVETTVADGRRALETDLSLLSDRDLERHIDATIVREGAYYREIWIPFWIFARDMSGVLAGMVDSWYDGDNELVLVELMTGVPKRTVTMEENHRLWLLSERIRGSMLLREAFEAAADGAEFLAALRELGEEGEAYLAEYERFLYEFGHRGHADRDTWFARRCEDPNIDYRSITAMLSVEESQDPIAREHEINARREAVAQEVVERIRRRPFGAMRAEAFKFALEYVLGFLMARDNERTMADMTTLAIKRGFEEIAHRLVERGVLHREQDVHFLAKHELHALLEGRTADLPLVKAKIAARRRDFEAYLTREANLPTYMHRSRALELDAPAAGEDGVLRGIGTSRGKVTGTARVVHSLEEIGRVKPGEILICHATDPGWTPVFIVISALVLETGGVLAHGSCLSREYGLPCVQLAGATGLIPDGATITVDGDTGSVEIAGDSADDMVSEAVAEGVPA